MIYATAFLSGAALMALEMVGGRLLAPSFGSSIFIWGSLIGVVLAALTVGYYAGGRLADQNPHVAPLAAILGASGLWTALIPVISKPVLSGLSGVKGAAGPLLSCVVLFFPPSVFMAMVTPWCMRLAISSIERSGRTSGVLNAVSNAGSIVGTFATSFYLIPSIGTTAILRVIASILLALALLVAVLNRAKGTRALLVIMILAGACIVALSGGTFRERLFGKDKEEAPISQEAGVIYSRESLYHNIYVENRGNVRLLRFDNSIQGGMLFDDPLESAYPYPDFFHLALALNPDIKDVLMIGLGAGLIPKRFHHDYPDMNVDVVELDPAVVDVAREYFEFPGEDAIDMYVQDGRVFLSETENRYDLIMIDAYFADSIPFHLTTVEFYELVKERLRPGGILASNLIGALEGERSKLFRSMYSTMTEVFQDPYVFAVYPQQPNTVYRNIEVFAVSSGTTADKRLTKEDFVKRAEELVQDKVTIKDFVAIARSIYEDAINTDDVPILTDDHAPVDSLLHLY